MYSSDFEGFEDMSKNRKNKSFVWKHLWYNQLKKLVKCVHCRHEMRYRGENGTTNLRNHLMKHGIY